MPADVSLQETMGHLTDDELRRIASRDASAHPIAEIARHLESCSACAARAAAHVDVEALARALDQSVIIEEHPDFEELAAYVDETLDDAERAWIDAHLEGCAQCREDIADLTDERAKLARRSGPSWRAWQLIAAVLLLTVAVAAIVFWLERPTPEQPKSIENPPVVQTEPPPDPWMTLEQDVLTAGQIGVPEILHRLRPPAHGVRGTSDMPDGTLHPVGIVVEEDRPAFSWPSSRHARYTVTIFASSEPVMNSGRIAETTWTPKEPLKRGTTYQWQVEVEHPDGGTTILPSPPAPDALFHVADDATIAELDAAKKARPDDHLLTGIVSARAGMRDRALADFDAHLTTHPNDTRAKVLADEIRRW